MQLDIRAEQWPLAHPLKITGHVFTDIDVIVVTLRESELSGRGEAASVYYLNTTPASMTAQIEAVRGQIEAGVTRETLQTLLPAGGARNALDCALWELDAKRTNTPTWKLAGLESPPRPLLTTFTLSADTPQNVAQFARKYSTARALKLKLTDDDANAARVRAVREARPDVWLGVDANQGFTRRSLEDLLPTLIEAKVALIEQPLRVGQEAQLENLGSPIPIAADESVQTLDDLPKLLGRFDMINIKLDKCGGLTEGLAIARVARRLGMQVMVGNMLGTSLAMAPAFILGQLCSVVDLDGPILFRQDREPSARYDDGHIWCPEQTWGAASSG